MVQEICECEICALKIDFTLDEHLISEVEKHNCVIFAGAGISTETGGAHPNSLYDEIRAAAKVDENPPFWELIDRFESQPNGRQKLIQLIKDRFDYINGFRDLKNQSIRFHSALGNAPFFKTIITTNWDRNFEDVMGATPFVYDSDIPFWETAKRPVIKIHGSIDNYSSLIASSADYQVCESRLREGALGAVVKQIFATKTCVICGYSAKDTDFRSIFSAVQDGLGQFARTHYLVSPHITDEEADHLKQEFGIVSIKTDASHFIETIKSHMQAKFCWAKDESFDQILEDLIEFRDVHLQFANDSNLKKDPHLLFAMSYQDGVIHALQRIVDRRMAGDFADLHRVQSLISLYDDKCDMYRKQKSLADAAYFRGYRNGLIRLVYLNSKIDDDPPYIPEFYHPRMGEMDREEYDNLVLDNPNVHKAALKEAQRKTAHLTDGMVIQHQPWG